MTEYISPYKGTPSRAASYVGIVLNFIILLFAGSMVGLGIWMIVRDLVSVLATVLPSNDFWDYIAYGLVAVGAVHVISCTVAIGAFFREARGGLYIYCAMLVLVFIGMAMFIGLPFWYREEIRRDLYNNMDTSLAGYKGEHESDHDSVFWNYVQMNYQCCGVDSEQDYKFTSWVYTVTPSVLFIPPLGNVTRQYPASCCQHYYRNQPKLKTLRNGKWEINPIKLAECYELNPRPNEPHSFHDGCYLKVRGFLMANMTLMGSVAIVLESLTVVLFILSCFVISANTRQEY